MKKMGITNISNLRVTETQDTKAEEYEYYDEEEEPPVEEPKKQKVDLKHLGKKSESVEKIIGDYI